MRSGLAWLGAWAFVGCIATPEDEGRCPCAGALRCCEAVDRCLPPDSPCFTGGPAFALVVDPPQAAFAGGTVITVSVEPAAPIRAVSIGANPCDPISREPFQCVAPPWRGTRAQVDLAVEIDGADGAVRHLFIDALGYDLPDFVEWPSDPLGAAHAVASLPGRFILAGADSPPQVVAVGPSLSLGAALPLPPLAGLHVEDLDRDGVPDLLALPIEGDPLRASTDGTDANVWWTAEPSVDTRHGLLLDLDGDGWADLVGRSERRGPLGVDHHLLLAHGSAAGFTPVADIGQSGPILEDGDTIAAHALVDHEGDADADVFLCGSRTWLLTIAGDGRIDGVFREAFDQPCGDIAVLDVNRDGLQDIAWVPALDYVDTPSGEARTGVFILRRAPEAFLLTTPQESPAEPYCVLQRAPLSTLSLGRSQIAAFDVDLDGDADLFLPAPHGRCVGGLVWYENAGDRFIARTVPGADASVQPTAVLPTDLDGDGDLDVIVTAAAPDRTRVWRNLRVERGDAQALVVRPTSNDARSVRGVRVSLLSDDAVQRRVLGSDGATSAHFGLGRLAPPYRGVVRWPGGREVFFEAAAPGEIEVPY